MATGADRIAEQLRLWRDDLIDLTRRNNLLNATGGRGKPIRIRKPEIPEVLARLEGSERSSPEERSWRFHYPPSEDLITADASLLAAIQAEDSDISDELADDELLTDVTSSLTLSKKLRSLDRRASSDYMDRGLRVLYLGFGLLKWSPGEGEWLESPLVMKPVVLERASPREPFRLVETEDDVVVNPALAVRLENDFGIILPSFEECEDVAAVLTGTAQAVRSQDEWHVSDDILFGAFTFHKEAMYRDLKVNEATIAESALLRAVAGDQTVSEEFMFEPVPENKLDEVSRPEEMASILDADSTQRQCILAARDGKTFVMDGPPGTGKSQTIANIIAELLGANKTVLFVSEKAAALEVVKSRLDEAHLGSYVLELHSNKATRKEVATVLGAALSERPQPASRLSSTDMARAIDRRKLLSAYAAAQNEIRTPFNRALHWAIGRRVQLEDLPGAPPPESVDKSLSEETFEDALEAARALAAAWSPVERGEEFLWRDLADPDQLRSRRSQVVNDLAETQQALSRLEELATDVASRLELPSPQRIDEVDKLVLTLHVLDERQAVPLYWLTNSDSDPRSRRLAELRVIHLHWFEGKQVLDARSPSWRQIEPSLQAETEEICASMESLNPPLRAGHYDLESVQRAQQWTDWLAREGQGIAVAGRQIEASLGLSEDLTIEGLRAVANLASLGLRPNLPEVAWFDRDELSAARRALDALRPLAEVHRNLVGYLRTLFTPAVFQFDIETLYDGPNAVAPNLSRVNGAGRANRRQIKACSISGQLSAEVIQALPFVRQWRHESGQLQILEAAEAGHLGSNYYRSVGTDFDALVAALDVAQNVLDSLHTSHAPESVSTQLSRSSSTAGHLAHAGQQLTQRLASWTQSLAFDAVALPGGLQALPPEEVAAWTTKAGPLLAQMAAVMGAIGTDLGPVGSVDQLRELLLARMAVARAELACQEAAESDRAAFGEWYQGIDSDWTRMQEASDWAARVAERFTSCVGEGAAAAILTMDIPTQEVDEALRATIKRTEAITGCFMGAQRTVVKRELGDHIDDARAFIGALSSSIGDIDEWASFSAASQRLSDLGLGSVIGHLVQEAGAKEMVAGACERAILTSWVDAVLAGDERCRISRAADRDQLVHEFRELDRQIVAQAAAKVIEVSNRRRPSMAAGEFRIIRTEAEKKRKHRPILTLLDDAGQAAQALKPCFMMSPLTVSQFLPSHMRFDAVIFDEASQVRPGDAVGALYRGGQLIVAGDNKQLPPTSFFDRTMDDGDDYDPDEFDDFESLLDLCRGANVVPELPLRWHYRSQHEDLITYSNRTFYGGKLVTFPSAIEDGPDVGLQFFYVNDGVYGRGTSTDNQVEAKRVVERVIYHADHNPKKSVGVVAFSEAQATRIQWELESARRDRPDLDDFFQESRLNGFFIKNLETVQGDERDTIILSIGYGPDENGKITMNFGPLNKPGGGRRLNVAITRARGRFEVVSSVRAIDFGESANPAVRQLQGYLDFAERGKIALTPVLGSEGPPESPFEEAVMSVLQSWGYEVAPQVGQAGYRIDLGIRHPEHPGQWLLGVECDGAAYHSSKTARDRDRLRQEVLEGLGWHLHRIWGPSWYHDRAGSEQRLRIAISYALSGDGQKIKQTAKRVEVEIETVDFDAGTLPGWTVPYRLADLDRAPAGASFDSMGAHPRLVSDVLAIVEVEGPVHHEVIMERLRDPWLAHGARARFRRAVTVAIQKLILQKRLEAMGSSFVALKGTAEYSVRVPVDGDDRTIRPVKHVPSVEIAHALLLLVRDAKAIDERELAERIARIFGWRRTGSVIYAELTKLIVALAKADRLEVTATGSVVLPR